MKKVYKLLSMLMFLVFSFSGYLGYSQNLIITGVFDGSLSGGSPKVLELYVVNDISDLSSYTIKNQTNANTTWGSAFVLSGSATAGDFIYVVNTGQTADFNSYFANTITPLESGVINLNGDDRLAIFYSGGIVDIFGEENVDGTGLAWEWLDGWAYRTILGTLPATAFTISNWNYSGTGVTVGETSNATAATPFPIGTFTMGGPVSEVDWCNLQWPDATTVNTDEAFTVYARVYESGVTEAAGQGAGIECWIGYSTSDTDPSTWTDWVAATYNVDNGNNDEYSASLSFPTAGTYYYASRFSLNSDPYSYGGYNAGGGDFWDGTDNVSGVATVNVAGDTFVNLPVSEDFESGLGNVTFINGTQTNYWVNGPLASQTGNCIYITNDGTANDYTITTSAVSHAYIPVDFAGIRNATLSFDWICNGEYSYSTNYDYLRVFLVPEDITIEDGTQISSTYQLGSTYNLETSLQNENFILSNTEITQDRMRLVFSWRNDGSGGTTPPASVDNILLEEITCPDPSTLTATNITAFSADLAWTENGSAVSWNIEWGADGFSQGSGTVITETSDNPYNLTGLSAVTAYDFYIQSHCGVGDESAWIGPFSFTTTVSCPAPTSLFADNITISSANLNWTENGTTDTWNLKVSSSAIDPTTQDGDIIANESTINNPYTSLSGLTSATTYYFYVQSDCGSGDLSEWSVEGTFTTDCEVENIPTASQSFELSPIPVCWTTELISGSTNWASDDSNDGVSGAHTGTYFMGKNWNNSDALIYSQPINMTSSSTGARVNVWIYRSADSDDTDRIRFHVNTSASLTGATQLLEIFPLISETPVVASAGWYNYIVNIPATFDSSPAIYIIAQGTTSASYSSYGLGFDDFLVEAKPSCPDPSTLTATNITAISADLAWTENGSATSWNIEWGATGFSQGSGTLITETTDNPYNLTGLTAVTDYDFYVQSYCGVGDESAWIGPFSFSTTVSCPAPTSLFADNITVSSANLNWTENGTTDTWNLKVSSSAIDPETQDGDIVVNESTIDNPYTSLSGLDANTTYYFYVQSDCGSGNLSDWSAEETFTTSCAAITTLPWTEDFETSVVGGMANCWYKENGDWITTDNSSSSYDTDARSGSNFLRDAWSATNEYVWTVGFELTAGTSYNFEFWWAGDGYSSWTGDIFYNTDQSSTGATQLGTSFISSGTTAGTSYTRAIRTFVPATDGTYYFGISVSEPTGSPWYLSFDDFKLDLTPACQVPTTLFANNITTTFADLNWTEAGSATAWNIKASTVPINPSVEDGDFGIINTTENPFTTPDVLTPNTTYYWYVQADCGGDVSEWSDAGVFSTECDAVTVFPYTENFDGDWGTWCWNVINNDADSYTWSQSSSYITAHSGSWTAHGMGNNDDYLITPQFIINSASFTMDWWDVVEGSGYNNTYDVLVSTTDKSIASFTDNLGTFDCSNTTWTLHNLDLSAYDGQSIYIAFHQTYSAATNWGFGIDDFTVREMSEENDILTFSFAEQTGPAVIDYGAHTITVEVAMGTDPNGIIPTFTISDNATVDFASGVAQDFTNPFVYTVTSESSIAQTWTVNTTVASTLSSNKDILTFTFPEQTGAATIGANTVDIEVSFIADLSNLTPTITTSALSSVNPLSGVAQNFSSPVTYTVTAEDASTKDYTVTVTQEAAPAGTTCATAIPYTNINDPEVVTAINSMSRELWFTVTLDQTYVDVEFSTCASVYDTWLYVYDACGGNLLANNDDDNIGFCSVDNNQSLIQMESLAAGTYYVRITPYDNDEDISDPTTGLYVSGSNCGTPNSVMASNMTAVSADIIWTPLTEETTWNLKVSSASIDPTTDAADIFDGVVNTTPLQSIASLTAETDYYVYVQAACGSDWTAEYMFTTPATCPLPTGLDALVLGPNSATLTWDELGTSDWVIEVSTTQLTDPSTETGDILDNEFVAGSTGQYDISGLTENTTYYWYVMSDCGSAWSAEGTFTTFCEVISTLPFHETFNSDSPTEACWTVLNENGDGDTWDLNYTSNPYEGDQVAMIYTDYNAGANNDYLITPAIVLTGNEILTYQYRVQSSGEPNDFEVLLSTTGFAPADFTSVLLPNTSYANTTYAMQSVDLSSYTGTVYIAWHVNGILDGWRIYIDDVTVREISDENDILTWSFAEQTGAAVIDPVAHEVTVEVANGTALTALVPTFTVSDYATVNIASETANDFSVNPTAYTVTSESGTDQIWNIYVTEEVIYPQIANIDINNDVTNVSVCQGTDEATAIAALATQITITDTDAAEHVVDLTWTIDTYDGNTAADYNATGTFVLPDGVVQTDPVTPLEVSAVVTVSAPVTATFSFGTEYCLNATADALPATSDNAITGTWSPATIATDAAGTTDYIFTPDAGQCALETTIQVTVNDLPVVTCPETMAMTSADGVTALTGATPAGGVYSGTNVTDNNFDPAGLAIGSYVITYTYTDPATGCTNSCDFNIDIVTGIETISLEGVKVYPNPNSGEFTINFSNIEGNVTYQVYDTKGSIIINDNIFANGNTVKEVSLDLVPGIYYVKVVTAKQSYVEKLIVE